MGNELNNTNNNENKRLIKAQEQESVNDRYSLMTTKNDQIKVSKNCAIIEN